MLAIQLRENNRKLREEIERLRARQEENESKLIAAMGRQQAEIERLWETIVDRELEIKDHIREIADLTVSNATLDKSNIELREEIALLRNESHADEQRYQAAKVEIERLREELREAYAKCY